MGGIAGIVYPDVFLVTQLLTPMLNVLSQRGPTQREEHNFRNVQVGVCGSKLNANKATITAGLDGSFSNAKEVIAELKTEGCIFREETNQELIVQAYMHWGNSFLEHLQGDFALFVYDQIKDRIILARDRIGKKPLYWYDNGRHFIFASELKAIIATGAVPQTIAIDSLAAYLYFGYIPQDMSPIKNVNKLLPGYYLQLDRNKSVTINPYWSYSKLFQNKNNDDRETIVNTIDHLLQESVAQRIPDQKPFGTALSGGLGSASVSYYLSKATPPQDIRAYTVEFKGENTEDTLAAREIASNLHIPHHCGIITPNNFLNDYVKIAWHLDEPLADPNVVATWHLAKMAEPTHTLFSGMGSDELLAGHSRYTIAERTTSFADYALQAIMPILKVTLLPLLTRVNKQAAYSILQKSRVNPWHLNYLQHNALFSGEDRLEASPLLGKLFDPIVFLHKFHNLSKIPSTVSSFLYFDVKTRLPDCFMLQYERFTSAFQLEWQTPFLTTKIIEYVAGFPEPDQLSEKDAFFILKETMKNTFPSSFIDRPKKTRPHFLEPWANSRELTKLFQLLVNGTLMESGLISRDWLLQQLKSPEQQKRSFKYLWGILALETWFHLYINRPMDSKPPQLTVSELLTES